jgi:hypothetical protein
MTLTKYKNLTLIALSFILISISCVSEHGIEPKSISKHEFGFGGNIVFYGAWPDSVKLVVLIVFKDPLLKPEDFVITNVGLLRNPLPLGIQTFQYSSLDSSIVPLIQEETPPSEYHYAAVASAKEFSLERKDWFVRGVYYASGNTSSPGIISIPKDGYIDNINIYCDFNNPPPQPPGGN